MSSVASRTGGFSVHVGILPTIIPETPVVVLRPVASRAMFVHHHTPLLASAVRRGCAPLESPPIMLPFILAMAMMGGDHRRVAIVPIKRNPSEPGLVRRGALAGHRAPRPGRSLGGVAGVVLVEGVDPLTAALAALLSRWANRIHRRRVARLIVLAIPPPAAPAQTPRLVARTLVLVRDDAPLPPPAIRCYGTPVVQHPSVHPLWQARTAGLGDIRGAAEVPGEGDRLVEVHRGADAVAADPAPVPVVVLGGAHAPAVDLAEVLPFVTAMALVLGGLPHQQRSVRNTLVRLKLCNCALATIVPPTPVGMVGPHGSQALVGVQETPLVLRAIVGVGAPGVGAAAVLPGGPALATVIANIR
mmetsp:Transcript_20849/g.45811  ORF Transcript_20849/g.45811 Transcript_20849/m.45811 type:complete len:359 (-) Transcript_20849:2787-3863(-)